MDSYEVFELLGFNNKRFVSHHYCSKKNGRGRPFGQPSLRTERFWLLVAGVDEASHVGEVRAEVVVGSLHYVCTTRIAAQFRQRAG